MLGLRYGRQAARNPWWSDKVSAALYRGADSCGILASPIAEGADALDARFSGNAVDWASLP